MARGSGAQSKTRLNYKWRKDPAPREGAALRHLHSMEAKADLRAYEEYLIVDAGMPTNDMAWVVLSVPDRLAELEKRLI